MTFNQYFFRTGNARVILAIRDRTEILSVKRSYALKNRTEMVAYFKFD